MQLMAMDPIAQSAVLPLDGPAVRGLVWWVAGRVALRKLYIVWGLVVMGRGRSHPLPGLAVAGLMVMVVLMVVLLLAEEPAPAVLPVKGREW